MEDIFKRPLFAPAEAQGEAPEILDDMPTFEEQEAQDTEPDTDTAEEPQEAKETLSPYEEAILAEMTRRAQTDEQIAHGLTSPEKNIKECYRYITAQARKQAVNGSAMIRDEVVFGWAVHYYTESKETIDAELKPKGKTNAKTPAKNAKKATPKAAPKPATKDNMQSLRERLFSSLSKKVETDKQGNRVTTIERNGQKAVMTELSLF